MQTFLPYEDFRASADGGLWMDATRLALRILAPFCNSFGDRSLGATINATKVESKAWGFQFPGTHR